MTCSTKSPAVGIDLGTTYSCVGVWLNNRVDIIANDLGNRTTPSCVGFTDKERLIGEPAKSHVIRNPSGTIFDAKRLIGRRFSDATVQSDMKLWPFQVVPDSCDKPVIVVQYKGEEKRFLPEEVSAMVLGKMREVAVSYLGTSIDNAVVTVPAYFNDAQRQATKNAGTIAGLNIMRIINEPTAAAIAYGFHRDVAREGPKNIFIFDLGGGTFDVSLVTIDLAKYVVKATAGDTHLGGEDFDNRMVDELIKEFKSKHNEDISGNHKALRRLRMQCEKAKRHLSTHLETEIEIECLYGGIDFVYPVTRAWFEQLNLDLFKKCLETVERCLKDANMEKSSIHDIVLVGGSTRIPMVQQLLKDFFDGKKLSRSINPDEAVAYGAAIEAAKLNGDDSKELQNLALYDVTSLSLGIDIIGDVLKIVVPRNTTIPVQIVDNTFCTTEDNQTAVRFPIYQGERAKSHENYLLGEFVLTDLPPAPRGQIDFNVCFEIDINGILKVFAEEMSTKKKSGITINNVCNQLSAEEIEKMVKDSERHKLEDEEYKTKEKERNALHMYAYQMRNAIRSEGIRANISYSEGKKIDDAIEDVFTWLKENNDVDVREITDKMKKLKCICKPIDH
ncbi:Heat shock protein [Nymphaea thermarum]|nr:Heat shock protein [Nymphaea thermarum]